MERPRCEALPRRLEDTVTTEQKIIRPKVRVVDEYASGEDHRGLRNGRRDQAARAGRFCGHQFHGRRSAIRLAG